MSISELQTKKILSIWDQYIKVNQKVEDTKGKDLGDIDSKREIACVTLRKYLNDFLAKKIDLGQFKTNVDSFNKQNNLWGFTSIKGQMFFNLMYKTSPNEGGIENLSKLLKKCIIEPRNLEEAKQKIDTLDEYVSLIFKKASDKRRAPNPASITYFLSYFWQFQNISEWPIMYNSMMLSFIDIGIWKSQTSPSLDYERFYQLNEEIKTILSKHTKTTIGNWEAEHAFWNFKRVTAYPKKEKKQKESKVELESSKEESTIIYKASFNIYDWIIPAVSKLVELGQASDKTAAAKGVAFEKAVSSVFEQLGFEVEYLGQGTGRNPDCIIKYRREHTAFLVDAKAYSDGYNPGRDDRAFREYIREWCPKLIDEGLNKIGFIIVSNSFNTKLDSVINDLTWNTDIKRFILFETDALLHLLAFKNKHNLEFSEIISQLVGLGSTITTQDIIQQFDDV